MEKKSGFPGQDIINEEARRYCEARATGNSGQMKASFNAIITRICEKNAEHKMLLFVYRKLSDMQKSILGVACYEELIGYTFDVMHKFMNDYDYNKNPNFCAWFIVVLKRKLEKDSRKETTVKNSPTDEKGNKIPQPRIVPASSTINGNNEDDNNATVFDELITEFSYPQNDNISDMRVKLISVYTLFFERKKGKAANQTKHEYYRIFVTESLIQDIRENNSLGTYNSQEIMQVADGGFVRFVAFTDFIKAEDIITMEIKKYSDIFENGEETELKLNHEARVIIEYRFVNGFDKKRVSAAAVSQQLRSFKEDMKDLMME